MKDSKNFIVEGILLTAIFYSCIFMSSCNDGIVDPEIDSEPEVVLIEEEDTTTHNPNCLDETDLIAWWEKCGNHDLCQLDSFPIICKVNDEFATSAGGEIQFEWTNLTSNQSYPSNHFIFAKKNEEIQLKLTISDSCVYILDYLKTCE